MSTTRQRLHEMLDAHPDDRLDEAAAVIVLMNVPYDDELTTAEDDTAITRGREAFRRGLTIPDDVVGRELAEL